jgi:cobalt-zinc-cadmium efflux system outer membrane protein
VALTSRSGRQVVLAIVWGVSAGGCARPRVPDPLEVAAEVRERTKAADATATDQAEAWLADGLNEDEAVGLALVRSPDFQAALADLGVAGATVAEAGQLRNPSFTLLLPWGPKQLEATLRWPLDALFWRGRRVKAAQFDADAVARRLVADGLEHVSRTRQAWADAALAQERGPNVEAGAAAREQIGVIAEERVRMGEVSTFEIGVARAERARAGEDRARQRAQLEIAFQHLGGLVGRPDGSVTLQESDAASPPCVNVTALLQEARAARPELRAAELTVEAAAGRVGLSRREALGLVAIADANQRSLEGFDAGPGFEVQIPLFHFGGGARERAEAELVRGRARLLALHQQVELEVRAARSRAVEADAVLEVWQAVAAAREEDLRLARARHEAGEDPLLVVLEAERQLADARLRLADARAELRKAGARLARAVGHEPTCGGTP